MFLNHKRLSLYLCLFIFTPALISCQTQIAEFSDSVSRPALNVLYKKIDQDKVDYNPEFYDLLGKSAVIFSMRVTGEVGEIPKEIFSELHNALAKKIRETAIYDKILTKKQIDNILVADSALNHSKDVYLDSLTSVSVSNREISNPLGKALGVDNFLVFQVDHLPLSSEKVEQIDRYIRMKLRLVDAESGYIVWTGIIEKLDLKDEDFKKIVSLSLTISDSLAEFFFNTFKRKWHKKIFGNLSKL